MVSQTQRVKEENKQLRKEFEFDPKNSRFARKTPGA